MNHVQRVTIPKEQFNDIVPQCHCSSFSLRKGFFARGSSPHPSSDVNKSRIVLIMLFSFWVMCFSILVSNAHSALHAYSDASGITVTFDLPDLQTETVEHDGVRYQTVRYDGSGFTDEKGNPRLPVSRVMLGVPANVTFHVEVLHATHETQRGYRIPPVRYASTHVAPRYHPQSVTSTLGVRAIQDIQNITEEWREDGYAYQHGGVYPTDLARISYEGTLRSQRLIVLQLHPVQYAPRTRILRTHPRLVVRVHFVKGQSLGGSSEPPNHGSPSESSSSSIAYPISPEEPARFERTFRKLLLNYDDAKRWRVRNQGNLNDALPAPVGERLPRPNTHATSGTRYKILVDETGIYRLSGEDLKKKWGITLSEDLDPRHLHLRTHGNREIPIYIKGEADGHFDKDDYIEFFGVATDDRYTRWNVYWLSEERERGVRVTERNAAPRDPTAKLISVFRSRVYFEEDHLTSNLEYVHPDDVSPNDKHGWFDALDFWYWTGIKNLSDFDSKALTFPLYDLAQSFAQPKIQITLQGGSPTDHEILVSLNDVRIGDGSVKWERQNTITIEKRLRVWDNLHDATKGALNSLNISRVDTAVEDDTTRYPYHVYINRFDIEYTRLLKAVNDYLEFASPVSKDPYSIRKRRRLQYTVKHFRSPEITIYEHDGEQLVTKHQNPDVNRVPLTPEERERFRAIYRAQVQSETSVSLSNAFDKKTRDDAPLVSVPLPNIPYIAYDAVFEAPDTHDSKFIAVSSAGVRAPVEVVETPSSDLLSPTNGADYLIITHPIYREPAERLAAWRATIEGGGHRTRIALVTEIYDLFSNGMVTPKAIKAFLKYAYTQWQGPAVSYVVILGDGTFDFRGIDEEFYPDPPEVVGYIPTHYIWTSSFGRTSVDHWYATVSGVDELADFYIGRLSVETVDEAHAIVDKIVRYEQQRPNGNWRRQIISVADDEVTNSGDFIFKKSLTEIERNHTLLGYETIKIFLEDVIASVNANPADYSGKLPQRVAKDMVIDALSEGSVIAQYAGHGGRIVWAHEAIFDNASVDYLAETEHIPFMMVLSCYNGYFDAASEPSMAEKLLRKPRGGIIGMLSATRLTYGSGNDTLNRIIFDDLFKRNERELGALSFDSKVELLMADGLGQIDVMMAYTLFGDPAMRLAMADYEMNPKVETKTVAPGGRLTLTSGRVFEATYDAKRGAKGFAPLSNFNGTLQVRAVFPGRYETVEGKEGMVEFYTGDLHATATAQIRNGVYPPLGVDVPKGAAAGLGYVEYYAENATHIAVGGDSFTVLVPKIVDIQPELVSESQFRIRIQVSDELGAKGVRSVTLDWRDPEQGKWHVERLVPDAAVGNGWYTTAQPLPTPLNGGSVRYHVTVTDVEGHRVESGSQEYRPYVYLDFTTVARESVGGDAEIYYRYSKEAGGWTLNVEVEQLEQLEEAAFREQVGEVSVFFFDGNPDINGDDVVDTDIAPIGRTVIRPSAWQRRDPLHPGLNVLGAGEGRAPSVPRTFRFAPLNVNWIAVATISHELALGTHQVFVWIDPVEAGSGAYGSVREGDEDNNISELRIEVDGTLVGQRDVRVLSRDGVVDFRVPSAAVAEDARVLTVAPLGRAEMEQRSMFETGQPSLTRIGLPNGELGVAYSATLEGVDADVEGGPVGSGLLNGAAPVEMRFDLDALRMGIRDELFGETEGADVALEPVALTPEQETAVEQGSAARAREIAMYLFVDELGKWTRLPSELVSGANGRMAVEPVVAGVRARNVGTGEIGSVSISPAGAPMGQWILLFTSESSYQVLLAEGTEPLRVIDPNRRITAFTDMTYFKDGVSINIRAGETPFGYGDTLSFIIDQSDGDPENATLFASALREDNTGTGTLQYIRLSADSTMPVDQWVILFVDSDRYRIEGRVTGVLARDGAPMLGRVGEEFRHAGFGLSLKITPGRWRFEAGDSFRFETRRVGRVRAQVERLGVLALMRSSDVIAPIIELGVGGQQFVDGDAISKTPVIRATLIDDNGIDFIGRPIRLEQSRDGAPFALIPQAEYRIVHRRGANQVVFNHASERELSPGTYKFRLTAEDTDGNESAEELKARVPEIVQLTRAMNYPNPFREQTTISCIVDGEADALTVKIYSLAGRLIYEAEETAPVGFVTMPWDGRDADGEPVANGVYYCKIRVKQEGKQDLTETIKLMKLR